LRHRPLIGREREIAEVSTDVLSFDAGAIKPLDRPSVGTSVEKVGLP